MQPGDSRPRYQCCQHCPDEGCPRPFGHPVECVMSSCEPIEIMFGEELLGGVTPDIISWQKEEHLVQVRESLIRQVNELVGYEPPGLRVLLRALSHPEVAGSARDYFDSMDTKYEPPWSCAREAEAQYQNIEHGWLGAANGIGYDESWCEPCRKKVMGT